MANQRMGPTRRVPTRSCCRCAAHTRSFERRGVLSERYGKVAFVGKPESTLLQVLRGASDANISFADLCALLGHLGFDERVRGSHHIFTKQDVREILNLQPRGSKAKPYQVKQVRQVIVRYKMAGESDE